MVGGDGGGRLVQAQGSARIAELPPGAQHLVLRLGGQAEGRGQRRIHSSQIGWTRLTGVCCSIVSLTSTPHPVVPGARHGSGRAVAANQSINSTGSRDGAAGCAAVGFMALPILPGARSRGEPRPRQIPEGAPPVARNSI